MEWHRIDLAMDRVMAGTYICFHKEFEELFLDAGAPREVALFACYPKDGSICLYLSPAATTLAAQLVAEYAAQPCERPSRYGLSLSVGYSDALDTLLAPVIGMPV